MEGISIKPSLKPTLDRVLRADKDELNFVLNQLMWGF